MKLDVKRKTLAGHATSLYKSMNKCQYLFLLEKVIMHAFSLMS